MLSSRPEMIAMRTALAEAESTAEFTTKMADLVKDLAGSESTEKAALVQALLDNHAKILIERQRIGMQAATGRTL